ncbi:hypothetical protein B0H19DRAFT_970506, partial [Mycena capillaripes]
EFALRDPEIALTHISPGFVNTPAYNSNHWAMWLSMPLLKPLLWMAAVSPAVCAEYMLFALFSGEKGFIRRNDKGDDIGMTKYAGTEWGRKKLWEHTVKEVDVETVA